jgi:heme-degrading monooxygenase HmoA
MLIERAEIQVKAGLEDEFAKVMAERGLPILKASPGAKSVRFGPGVENPSTFIFLVEWDSMDAHKAFNAGPSHPEFSKLFGPYAAGGRMEHFEVS